MMKLLLAASALTLIAAPPAHAQLLSGSGLGDLTGTITGTTGSVTHGATTTIRSTSRGEVRGDAGTRGRQDVDRRSGSVSIDRSVDAGLDAAARQVLDAPTGEASGGASGSARASGSGNANARLIGTDAVGAAAGEGAGRVRETTSTVRNLATPPVATARDRVTGTAGQAANAAGSAGGAAGGTASGTVGIEGDMLALAGSGAAAGEGALAVAPGKPVELPSGERLGTVRDIVATRIGEIRQLVVQTRDGLTTIPAPELMGSGDVLIASEANGSVSSEARAADAGTE